MSECGSRFVRFLLSVSASIDTCQPRASSSRTSRLSPSVVDPRAAPRGAGFHQRIVGEPDQYRIERCDVRHRCVRLALRAPGRGASSTESVTARGLEHLEVGRIGGGGLKAGDPEPLCFRKRIPKSAQPIVA